jgi:hypothetical protein
MDVSLADQLDYALAMLHQKQLMVDRLHLLKMAIVLRIDITNQHP